MVDFVATLDLFSHLFIKEHTSSSYISKTHKIGCWTVNFIGDGIMQMCEGLKENKTLTTLHMKGRNEKANKPYTQKQKRICTGNQILLHTWRTISAMLQVNNAITELVCTGEEQYLIPQIHFIPSSFKY